MQISLKAPESLPHMSSTKTTGIYLSVYCRFTQWPASDCPSVSVRAVKSATTGRRSRCIRQAVRRTGAYGVSSNSTTWWSKTTREKRTTYYIRSRQSSRTSANVITKYFLDIGYWMRTKSFFRGEGVAQKYFGRPEETAQVNLPNTTNWNCLHCR